MRDRPTRRNVVVVPVGVGCGTPKLAQRSPSSDPGPWSSAPRPSQRICAEGEDKMFGKAKSSSHKKDEQLPPAPGLQDLPSAKLAESVGRNLMHRSRHDSGRQDFQ